MILTDLIDKLTTEQMQQLINESIKATKITLYVAVSFLVIFLTFSVIESILLNKNRKKYIEKLNDHDKAVILDYKQVKAFQRGKK